ncbi:hypothetical protein PF005_g24983 [Phytophthora fragariae]|nr:hypothetical protein PF003_g25353 [Phytophthora fragariae]KAE8922227.1 hypothetical protein PF009_g27505 [Phytophthora fragariae]KAE8963692.1 hypothetical protein PF011_g28941 [Phytophthora fragariae]KAE9060965.1 hypothetical protein PF007_g30421 [Phytophthora fragariae]KAE9176388.1 hypothetical protein PF005_g24983 [Phytophthora fragariae]
MEKRGERYEVVWAAATALGRSTTTNNIAEFVGLHRLLNHAVNKQWSGLHVVGDSALILKMMENRRPPKAKKLLYWYRSALKLADQCGVMSWSHHYRAYNKGADWLANAAMDTGRSMMQVTGEDDGNQQLLRGVKDLMTGDMKRWEERRMYRAEGSGTC